MEEFLIVIIYLLIYLTPFVLKLRRSPNNEETRPQLIPNTNKTTSWNELKQHTPERIIVGKNTLDFSRTNAFFTDKGYKVVKTPNGYYYTTQFSNHISVVHRRYDLDQFPNTRIVITLPLVQSSKFRIYGITKSLQLYSKKEGLFADIRSLNRINNSFLIEPFNDVNEDFLLLSRFIYQIRIQANPASLIILVDPKYAIYMYDVLLFGWKYKSGIEREFKKSNTKPQINLLVKRLDKLYCLVCEMSIYNIDQTKYTCYNCGWELPRCIICLQSLDTIEQIVQYQCCGAYSHLQESRIWFNHRRRCPNCVRVPLNLNLKIN